MPNTTRNVFLWASAVVTAGFGLALLVMPVELAEQYGNVATDESIAIGRLFGAVTLAFSVLAITGLSVKDVEGRRAVDSTMFAGWLLIGAATLYNIYIAETQPANSIVGVTLVMYAVFAVMFGYFLFGQDLRLSSARGRPAAK